MRTVCHNCRGESYHHSEDEDGVTRIRHVPSAGDGSVVRLVAAAGGGTVATEVKCPDCGGTGWLPGFVVPC